MATVNLLVFKNLDVIMDRWRLRMVEPQKAIMNLLVSKSPNAVECLKVSIVDRWRPRMVEH